ncbi:hypothetical protein AVEN_13983-1, partial [Araneus ventricosus]
SRCPYDRVLAFETESDGIETRFQDAFAVHMGMVHVKHPPLDVEIWRGSTD